MSELSDYADAARKCEQLTKKMVDDVGNIMFLMRALEQTYSTANLSVVSVIDDSYASIQNTVSLPSFLLRKELSTLNSSLFALKNSIRANIRESLKHLDSRLSHVSSQAEEKTSENIKNLRHDYKVVLIESIQTLKNLESKLVYI